MPGITHRLAPYSDEGQPFGYISLGHHSANTGMLTIVNHNALLLRDHPDDSNLAYQKTSIDSCFNQWDAASLPSDFPKRDIAVASITNWLAAATYEELVALKRHQADRFDYLGSALISHAALLQTQGLDRLAELKEVLPINGNLVYQAAVRAQHKRGFSPLDSIEAGRKHAVALCHSTKHGARRISLGNLFEDTKQHLRLPGDSFRIVRHEELHAGFAEARAGFTHGVIRTHSPSVLLEEIGVEHWARVTGDGYQETFEDYLDFENPKIQREHGSYSLELAIFAGLALLESRISPELFGEAQASNRSIVGNANSRHQLVRLLNHNTSALLPEFKQTGFKGLNAAYDACTFVTKESFLRRQYAHILHAAGLGTPGSELLYATSMGRLAYAGSRRYR